MPYNISDAKRDWYRNISTRSRLRKKAAVNGELQPELSRINKPILKPEQLMPQRQPHGLRFLSLFSGGGGFDLGFERAGFEHVASFDILDVCGGTLQRNRPQWEVLCGASGDVTKVDWSSYKGKVDLIHGGPPCQPFSIAGKQDGSKDDRDMWPAFIDAVLTLMPEAFVAENVPGLLDPKFRQYVDTAILAPLTPHYHILKFKAVASDFGVPQIRKRVIFVGFRSRKVAELYKIPEPTHFSKDSLFYSDQHTMGTRAALGLEDIGFDCFAPTLRSGFTGPRKSTSILNSKASQKVWGKLQIWPNGVQKSREEAIMFPPENGHFRLSVQDCALLQGFPDDWIFQGAAYQILGQIGNSVCPPVGYAIAKSVLYALGV
jgi:DNA (cytosine-5)-methyltransferase 1